MDRADCDAGVSSISQSLLQTYPHLQARSLREKKSRTGRRLVLYYLTFLSLFYLRFTSPNPNQIHTDLSDTLPYLTSPNPNQIHTDLSDTLPYLTLPTPNQIHTDLSDMHVYILAHWTLQARWLPP